MEVLKAFALDGSIILAMVLIVDRLPSRISP